MEVIIINIKNKKKLEKIVKVFNDDGDEKALSLLFDLTKDPIVKIALNWRKEYEISLESIYTDASYMYDDIISYLYDKYGLKNLENINEIEYEEDLC